MRYFLFIFLFIAATFKFGQKSAVYSFPENFIVDSILIVGNDITEREIILRELTFETGDTVNQRIISFNRERVYSLGLFNKVNFRGEENNNKLIIDVEESWYFYPIPFFHYKNNSLERSTFGLNVKYKNFRGRNETLRAIISLGFDPSFQFSYFNPILIPKNDISLFTELILAKISNKSEVAEKIYGSSFDYEYYSYSLSLGKRIDIFHNIKLGFSFNYIASPVYIPSNINASDSRIDRTPVVSLGYFFDSRDLAQFAENGIYAGLTLTQKGFGVDGVNYFSINTDVRHYQSLFGDLSGKWRIAVRGILNEEDAPLYDHSYIGYGENVRGHYYETLEGHHRYLTSVELFYPIVKELNVKFDLPIIPKKLTSYRLGFYISAFADAGSVRYAGEPLALNRFVSGYGLGLSILFLPYEVIRFEYALNEFLDPEFIIETGFSF